MTSWQGDIQTSFFIEWLIYHIALKTDISCLNSFFAPWFIKKNCEICITIYRRDSISHENCHFQIFLFLPSFAFFLVRYMYGSSCIWRAKECDISCRVNPPPFHPPLIFHKIEGVVYLLLIMLKVYPINVLSVDV